ncbi:MAG: gephyrin-like molybdotransferase Glp [Pseudomonadota bacterium]
MISVEEARARVLASVEPGPSERIPIETALGRVTAEPVYARRTHPPHDVSAMDGYAVRAADVTHLPITLKVVEAIPAGSMPQHSLSPGESSRIFTGAVLPNGADTIVLQEDAEPAGDGSVFIKAIEPERHVRVKGLDFEDGAICVAAGVKLSPANLGLLSAANVPSVRVYCQPTVAFLSTGSELVPHGQTLEPGQIISSNGVLLATLAQQCGARAIDLGPVEDDIEAIRRRAKAFRTASIAVTVGGASVGDHDLIQPALKPEGLAVDFWKIAMRPGKPLIFGQYADRPFLGLPGNPVSAFVCALLFLKPMIEQASGLNVDPSLKGLNERFLAADLPANGPRMNFLRATDDGRVVTPLPIQDSSMLSALAASTCLIVRPPKAAAAKKDTAVSILSLIST